MSIADYRKLGFLPLQDHGRDVVTGRRQQVAGGRIVTMEDATAVGGDPTRSAVEFGAEDNMGTLGDVHPWMFWQTSARGARASGSWAQVFAGVIDDDAAAGPTTGGGSGPAVLLPIAADGMRADLRYAAKGVPQVRGLPIPVKGSHWVILPATDETEQVELALPADGRLWCPSVGGPGASGSLVVDLQPDGSACMDNAQDPGIGGRHARLQSVFRVVAFPVGGSDLGVGNSVALNFGQSPDGIAGYGMIWAPMDGGGSGQTGPTTGGGQDDVAESLLGKAAHQFGKFRPTRREGYGVALLSATQYGPIHAGHGSDQHHIGNDRDGNPINSGHLATGALWYRNAREDGPMLFEGDYPHPGPLPLQSRVHLTWDASTMHPWRDGPRTGFWRWWAEVPYVVPQTPQTPRPPTGGPPTPPTGGPRTPIPGGPAPRGPTTPGKRNPRAPAPPPTPGGAPGTGGPAPWRPRFEPVDPQGAGGGAAPLPPITGSPPKFPDFMTPPERFGEDPPGPITPGADRPGDPGEPGGGLPVPPPWGQFPDPWTPQVGGTAGAVSLFLIHHPFMESWSAQSVRPQLWVSGEPNLEHSQGASAADLQANEERRPQVLGVRSWGAQDGSGWDYTVQPEVSRARGGTADGGVLFCPPEFEPEDYLVHDDLDVDTPATTSYLLAAPGVSFALGKPATDGGLAAASAIITQAATGNRIVSIKQLNASRVATSLLSASVDQSSGEIVVAVHGEAGMRIPYGGDADRVATPAGGEFRISNEATRDVLEWYDSQTAGWKQVLPAPASPAEGAMLIFSSGEWVELAPGTNGNVLKMVSGYPAWDAP